MSRVRPKSAGRVRSTAGLPSPAEQLAQYGSAGAAFVEQQSPCGAAIPGRGLPPQALMASLRQPHLSASAEREPPSPVSPGWPQADRQTPTAEGASGVIEAASSVSPSIPPPVPTPARRAQSEQAGVAAGTPGGEASQACCRNPSMSPPPSQRGRIGSAPAGGPRRRGAAAAAATAVNSQAKRAAAARARNPFIEYDVREKRLIRERKWLQEDSTYLFGRKEELRYSTLMKKHNIECESKQDLYEKRTYYGPYSVKLKSQKQRAASAGRQRPASAAPAGEAHAVSVKKMAQELKNSCSDDFQKSFIRSLSGWEKDLFIQRLSDWEIDLLRSRGISLEDSPRDKLEPLQDMKSLFARSFAS
eukprot:TRINITY_DN27652_c0_g1_i1.p1 TRINITY_DN27652_c0_g1~~TRINITY_DN27652_c0_g1_i1.p1  ORF type:complete len:360 (-),score=70.20 TRINITY_DN27652_c0_g1_i1:30-1109(-)